MPVIPVFRSGKQEDLEFKASLGYIARTLFQTKEKKIEKDPAA
jgi:hypothetical protein